VASAVEQGYIREGHADARVRVKTAIRGSAVDVCVVATLGPKVTIASLTFPGLTGVPAADLVAVMHGGKTTNHVGGVLDADALETDTMFLTAALFDRGFPEAKVQAARVVRTGNTVAVAIPIAQGPKFHLGRIVTLWAPHVAHDLKSGEVFSRKRIADAREQVEAQVGVPVVPLTHIDVPTRRIDIAFQPEWRWPWHALAYWSSHSH